MLVFRPLLSTFPANIWEDQAGWGNGQCGQAPFSSGPRGGGGLSRTTRGSARLLPPPTTRSPQQPRVSWPHLPGSSRCLGINPCPSHGATCKSQGASVQIRERHLTVTIFPQQIRLRWEWCSPAQSPGTGCRLRHPVREPCRLSPHPSPTPPLAALNGPLKLPECHDPHL